MLVGGEAHLDGAQLGLYTPVHPASRPRGSAVERQRRPSDADGRAGVHDPRAMCSGTSFPRHATGSTRPRRTGKRFVFLSSPATIRNIFPCPPCPKRSAIRDRVPPRSAENGRNAQRRAGWRWQKPAAILLHGFPEFASDVARSRAGLEDDFFLIMPDQRGFAGSDRPQDVEAYRTELLVDDIFALADALAIERFSLVGHDWGGSIAWIAAAKGDPRLERLAIINAPHLGGLPEEPHRARGTAPGLPIYHHAPQSRRGTGD